MNEVAAQRATSVVTPRSTLPDRMRLAVAGLYRCPGLSDRITAEAPSLPDRTTVYPNPVTGQVLLMLGPGADPEAATRWLEDVARSYFAELGLEPNRERTRIDRLMQRLRPPLRVLSGNLIRVLELRGPRKTPTSREAEHIDHGRERKPRNDNATPTPAAEPWHVMPHERAVRLVDSNAETGLDDGSARARLLRGGANDLGDARTRSPREIFLDQLRSAPVAMLGASAALSLLTGGVGDAVLIGTVVALNAAIGFVTEHGAERAVASLNRVGLGEIRVRRGARALAVAVRDVVVGDILILSPGVRIAADARLLSVERLTVDESALTGESVPVKKRPVPIDDPRLPLAARRNMVYRGTVVTGGGGEAVVIATGRGTEIGNIQSMLDAVKPPETAMQRQLRSLGGFTIGLSSAACAAVFVIGLLRGQSQLSILKTAISLAVAAVPEGLPTVAITTLALGLTRMREQNALVRRLDAVETLGALQVVCFDKTGTITEGKMSVVELHIDLETLGTEPDGRVPRDGDRPPSPGAALYRLLEVALLCNELEIERVNGSTVLRGSATETALAQLALDAGLDATAIRTAAPRQTINHRSEGRNVMSTLHQRSSERPPLLAVKGRPAEVLERCTRIHCGGEVRELTADDRARIERQNERMSGRALRVLGLAYLEPSAEADAEAIDERQLIWLGLAGLADPARPRMRALIEAFHAAGVRTVMITGDQSATAYAVGKQIGLSHNGRMEILDSAELEGVAPEVMTRLASRVDVFSRVSPRHKLQIVQALQASGQIVAMTGDGINDGPALRAADLGVAMGAGGTSVAREVADIVLEDDNLETMIEAIRQGRTIYEDVRKAVRYILATNASEILVTLAMVTVGFRNTLTPMQLLWINFATDIFPELALAVQPAESDVLARPPRDPEQPMFSRADYARITLEGALISGSALTTCLWAARRYGQSPHTATIAFLTLVGAQLLQVLSARSEGVSIFDDERLPENRYVPLALGGGAAMTLATQLVPGLRRLLGSAPISPLDWAVVGTGSVVPLLISELTKRKQRPTNKELSPDAS